MAKISKGFQEATDGKDVSSVWNFPATSHLPCFDRREALETSLDAIPRASSGFPACFN